MAKEDGEDLEKSTKCWICDNICLDCDVSKISLSYHEKI